MNNEREKGTGVVNTEEAIAILRAIVASSEHRTPLMRLLVDEFKPETRLSPFECRVDAELIESAMKALGMDYPKAPKPRKIPFTPTDTQAAALRAMTIEDENGRVERLNMYRSYGRSTASYWVNSPTERGGIGVREPSFQAMLDYRWIEYLEAESRGEYRYYQITQAGRDVLARYDSKKAASVPSEGGRIRQIGDTSYPVGKRGL